MTHSDDLRSSVRVNGELLKSERKKSGHTQLSFAEACESVSLATIRRAEQGHRVARSSLRRMAEVLGQPQDHFIRPGFLSQKSEFAISVAGDWVGLFIEADRGVPPYVVMEETHIQQQGDKIIAESLVKSPNETRRERYEDCRVVHNAIVGLHHIDEWQAPFGIGAFILKSSRNDDWLEGFSSWFDPDTDRIETSRYILVRKNSAVSDKYIEEAKSVLEQDLYLYQLRKLIETGYSTTDAVKMLAASFHE